jgi:hypothetical protein
VSAELPKAAWSGEIRFGPCVLKCHVLDDGRRIIEQESFEAFMRWFENAEPKDLEQGAADYQAFMRGVTPCPR